MAALQHESPFFRLPLELREEIYKYCQLFYTKRTQLVFNKRHDKFGTLLQRHSSGTPALLLSCKRIKAEAERRIHRNIQIIFGDHSGNGVYWLDVLAVSKPKLNRVRELTVIFEDLMNKPVLVLRAVKHIIKHAPDLRVLEITWEDMVHWPLTPVISLEKNIVPWFSILAKAKSLRKLKLNGVTQEWATAVEENLRQKGRNVKMEVELIDVEAAWGDMLS
ncbi:hypothetical protein F4781DRAFT_320477 [Annulohypoxylon bovei var. microspora]|nr:hypothetical protein F4781DRAFT_320477 [Annulohypoxylon bovei var. microspora]